MPHRRLYLILFLTTIPVGLLSRSSLFDWPKFLSTYAGDAIWALMVFFLVCLIFPYWKIGYRSAAALLFAFAIEFSQLYHAPWIDGIRQTRIGGLVLGFGFLPSDLICYSAGVLVGFAIDALLVPTKAKDSM